MLALGRRRAASLQQLFGLLQSRPRIAAGDLQADLPRRCAPRQTHPPRDRGRAGRCRRTPPRLSARLRASSPDDRSSTVATSATCSRPKRRCAQRERTVGSSVSGRDVTSTNTDAGSGSSSVLSSAFCAATTSASACSMIVTRLRPSKGRKTACSIAARTCSILIDPLSPGSIVITSGCAPRAMRRHTAHWPHAPPVHPSLRGRFSSCAIEIAVSRLPTPSGPRQDKARRQRLARNRLRKQAHEAAMADNVPKCHICECYHAPARRQDRQGVPWGYGVSELHGHSPHSTERSRSADLQVGDFTHARRPTWPTVSAGSANKRSSARQNASPTSVVQCHDARTRHGPRGWGRLRVLSTVALAPPSIVCSSGTRGHPRPRSAQTRGSATCGGEEGLDRRTIARCHSVRKRIGACSIA